MNVEEKDKIKLVYEKEKDGFNVVKVLANEGVNRKNP